MDALALLERFDIAHLRADNPGPMTLSGTNTWIVGRAPCVVIDPGPALDDHLDAIEAEVAARDGASTIALTHDHHDHTEAVAPLAACLGDPPVVRDGEAGPLRAVATPGHSPDSVTWLLGEDVAFTGDAVLGEGSVFVSGDLGAYLDALRALRALPLQLACPGHGPPIDDPAAKLDGYIAHRLAREKALLAGLENGARTVDELLDAAWGDVPAALRPAAALSLGAHLDKLETEGRLPAGVQSPPRLT